MHVRRCIEHEFAVHAWRIIGETAIEELVLLWPCRCVALLSCGRMTSVGLLSLAILFINLYIFVSPI